MELTFPFRNWTYNSLLKLFEIDIIKDYFNSEIEIDKWSADNFDVKFYQDRVPSFENELLQILDTTNQETIDYYFTTLSDDIRYVKTLISNEYLEQEIEDWNMSELEKFNELVAKKTGEYSMSPDRKRNHLEEYEEEFYPLLFGGIHQGLRKVKKINYNYYCIEDKLNHVDPAVITEYLNFLKEQVSLFIAIANKYGIPWQQGNIKAKSGVSLKLKPILFCEGEIDITLIVKAADLLGKNELLSKIELRYRGSYSKLDSLWTILTENNWETVPQKKILLYDCDTNREDRDFGHIHKRTTPKIESNIIQRGIENLFPETTITKALAFKKEFIDFKNIKGTERGKAYERSETCVNKHEKRNFCNWLIGNGTKEDFANFKAIFDILEALV